MAYHITEARHQRRIMQSLPVFSATILGSVMFEVNKVANKDDKKNGKRVNSENKI